MSMPDKTVCEKHYIQAKKRAANSAMRANLKKAKRKSMSLGESDVYLESKSDDFDAPLSTTFNNNNNHSSSSGRKLFDKVSKNQFRYTPDPDKLRRGGGSSAATRRAPKPAAGGDDSPERGVDEENWASESRANRSLDANATTVSFYYQQSNSYDGKLFWIFWVW